MSHHARKPAHAPRLTFQDIVATVASRPTWRWHQFAARGLGAEMAAASSMQSLNAFIGA
ncbi:MULTISPECIES: hypothetical protein [Delftia]|uniref:Uncharacterized protein n=2 Tax=Delftia TaxID=80865 RepID=A0A7T2S2P2_DELAC|nr:MULTISPECIES: hypothetical protein [Delftia]QPS07492.1 hypothetical protein I6G66_24950 [Delftia acidovorans]